MFGPYIPVLLFKIGFNTKGCLKTYNLMMDANQNIVIETQYKWAKILHEEIPYHIVERSFKQIFVSRFIVNWYKYEKLVSTLYLFRMHWLKMYCYNYHLTIVELPELAS